MATIRRHPIPPESYDPDRPLNDLLRDQFLHFVHVQERLPAELRAEIPVPSPDDVPAVNQFIAAVTAQLMSIKRSPPLRVVRKSARKSVAPGITLAAHAAPARPPRATKKKSVSGKAVKSKSAKAKSAPKKPKPKTKSKPQSKPTRRGR